MIQDERQSFGFEGRSVTLQQIKQGFGWFPAGVPPLVNELPGEPPYPILYVQRHGNRISQRLM